MKEPDPKGFELNHFIHRTFWRVGGGGAFGHKEDSQERFRVIHLYGTRMENT